MLCTLYIRVKNKLCILALVGYTRVRVYNIEILNVPNDPVTCIDC